MIEVNLNNEITTIIPKPDTTIVVPIEEVTTVTVTTSETINNSVVNLNNEITTVIANTDRSIIVPSEEVIQVTVTTSGATGKSGSSGTSGSDSTSGSSGTSGIGGTSGVSGSNGTSGITGTSGINGSSGTSVSERISDFVDGTSYMGRAPDGSLETSPVWIITKIIVDTDGTTLTTSVNNVAWVDRFTAIYT